MVAPKDEDGGPNRSGKAGDREARLAQELRANLLKRKAQAKAKAPKRPPNPREEGGQSTG
jgi:hypothetical protein